MTVCRRPGRTTLRFAARCAPPTGARRGHKRDGFGITVDHRCRERVCKTNDVVEVSEPTAGCQVQHCVRVVAGAAPLEVTHPGASPRRLAILLSDRTLILVSLDTPHDLRGKSCVEVFYRGRRRDRRSGSRLAEVVF
jgi:hypothetical protein